MFLTPPPKPDYDGAADLVLGLPKALGEARARLGISHALAAGLIGIGKDTLVRLEAGLSSPTQPTVVAALRWLAIA